MADPLDIIDMYIEKSAKDTLDICIEKAIESGNIDNWLEMYR